MNLVIQDSQAVQAWKSTSCAALNDAQLLPTITNYARKVCVFTAQKLPENVDVFAALVAAELRKLNCTIEQFKIAVDKGMVNTEIYSASAPATYVKWVRSYLDEVQSELIAYRADMRRKQEEEEEQERKAQITPEYILEQKKKAVEMVFDNYKQTGKIEDPGSVAYFYLEEIGEINIPLEDKKRLFAEALERVKKNAEDSIKSESDKLIRVQIRFAIDAIENDQYSKLNFEAVKLCRANALIDYYAKQNQTAV